MAKILITGGSGLVGKAISAELIKQNHEPLWLSREAGSEGTIKKFKWNVEDSYIDEKAFEGVEHIIHLAGAGIADKRWTKKYKIEIISSRVKSSDLLFEYITRNNYKIKTLVGGSAIGYYGARQSNNVFKENDHPGNDFLADTSVLWEKSYLPFARMGIRNPIIRTGVVLSNKGGAYKKMAPPFKFGLGAALATGRQFIPWIHINDIAGIFTHAVTDNHLDGVYNGVASELVTNKHFSSELAASFAKPFFLPKVPSAALHLAMGESAVMVTEGLKISNQKIKLSGYHFQFETLKEALQQLALNKAT